MFKGKKTYIGILIAILPTALGVFGYTITVEGAAELGGLIGSVLENAEGVVVAGGALFAGYGRLVAHD